MQASQPNEPSGAQILSPFSDTESQTIKKHRNSKLPLWVTLATILILATVTGGFFLVDYLNDPLRTLEPFPVTKYLESYKSLAGSKFRADLRVENDLGWKEGVGRLMVFSVKEDTRPIAIMIPPALAQIYFTKGQAYRGEIEVKEGGLIYANAIRKD